MGEPEVKPCECPYHAVTCHRRRVKGRRVCSWCRIACGVAA